MPALLPMTSRDIRRAAALLLLFAFAGPARATEAVDLVVIVNANNPVRELSQEDAARLFLKKRTNWPDGNAVLPANQTDGQPVREAFCRDVLHKSTAALAAYWQQQIFSGRDIPPPEFESDAAVVAFVKSNPRAIGYVSRDALAPGVKAIVLRN